MHYDETTSDWRDLPNGARADGHLFAIPDIHGQADLLERMLAHVDRLPRPKPRTGVFLGDLIDRGPENLRAIDLALNAKMRFDKHVILPGNHEGMLIDGLDLPLDTGAFKFWYANGGYAVVDELTDGGDGTLEELREQLRVAFPKGFLDDMRTAPGHYRSGDLTLLHAGMRPPLGPDPAAARARFLAQPLADAPREHWAWIRRNFLEWRGGWDEDRREVIVHGHTILADRKFDTAHEAAVAADFVKSHARLSLDMGIYKYGQLLCLEVLDGRYRVHLVTRREYLP